MDRVTATYEIETAFPLRQAAETMAGEQSTGTFVRVPGETDALREAHAARVEELVELGEVAEPSLPGSGLPSNWDGKRRRARAVLSWPTANMGLGTRELAGVHGRPIIGTIIKPSVGMSPEATATQVRTLVEAGIDFIKDDELQADGPHCPFDERISAVMRVINDHADKTGKRVMFAANLTGEIDEMLARHDHVLAEGGTCIMASMNSIGLPAMKMLRAHSQLPIHGHRNGWGMLGRSPAIGMSYIAFQKLWRLAGIDHTHVNGIDNKFCESNESVIASARECLTPMFPAPHKGCEIMPVFSSGQSAKHAAPTYAALGSVDCMFAAGGGIMAHPGGPAAGVRALQQAWEAAVAGVPVEQAANDAPELKAALGAFGG